jgi:hypothetical protein
MMWGDLACYNPDIGREMAAKGREERIEEWREVETGL